MDKSEWQKITYKDIEDLRNAGLEYQFIHLHIGKLIISICNKWMGLGFFDYRRFCQGCNLRVGFVDFMVID